MEKHKYTCNYCFEEFIPKRRRVQKFCSATCRSKAHHLRQTSKANPTTIKPPIKVPPVAPAPSKSKVEAMSSAGVGNVVVGTLIADGIKALMAAMKNKPATKGELNELLEKLNNRYHLIKNMAPNLNGEYPYFDLVENVVIYSK
ncbi:hypothetical protein A9Q87_13345 [Flavobacteriales bacterium 34_180_T64]|nr:hypothetical protein A9Q87_13345 [Flavobacteriales bacterium 34_180_T64]